LCISVMMGSFSFLAIATKLSRPVSTTHAIVGSLVCVGIVAKGTDSVGYDPLIKSAITWVLSPIAGGLIGWTFYKVLKRFLVDAPNPDQRAGQFLPILSGMVSAILMAALLFDGPERIRPNISLMSSIVILLLVSITGLSLPKCGCTSH
jgi:inorganic phosphate transporter, PiT family